MTALPATPPQRRLGLVIDLDTCVGCQACVVACKSWNTSGHPGPLGDARAYGADPVGAWLNRVHGFEAVPPTGARTVHVPRSCLHCENALCVTVCPTGASYKRAADGIVLVDAAKCMGCGLCAWACPYGAREMDPLEGVMRKCTLCIDRIGDAGRSVEEREPACVTTCPARARHFGDLADPASPVARLVAERGGVALAAELGYRPTNRYLPPRAPAPCAAPAVLPDAPAATGLLGWLDRLLSD
jgi:Fe-S-cluster-containing dehydrogenase component